MLLTDLRALRARAKKVPRERLATAEPAVVQLRRTEKRSCRALQSERRGGGGARQSATPRRPGLCVEPGIGATGSCIVIVTFVLHYCRPVHRAQLGATVRGSFVDHFRSKVINTAGLGAEAWCSKQVLDRVHVRFTFDGAQPQRIIEGTQRYHPGDRRMSCRRSLSRRSELTLWGWLQRPSLR